MSLNDEVLHCVPSIRPEAGGPSRTVVQLADSLAEHTCFDVSLLTQGAQRERAVPSANMSVNRIVRSSDSRVALKAGLPIRELIQRKDFIRRFSIIHNHGIWLPSNHWAAAAARQFDIPFVLHSRGMLEPWAINHHSFKKRLAMALFQRRDIETAAVIMATSKEEYRNIRALGFSQPIAVIPNGIELLEDLSPPISSGKKTPRSVLFLSRIHPKKGLINLINAWAKVQPEGWILNIAGPDEGGHKADVVNEVNKLNVADQVHFIGEVDGQQKKKVYQNADVFVLPTASENFGVVVAEALAHGIPVITTKGAPWSELESYDCGWWIDNGTEPLVNALRSAINLSDAERCAMGERGRSYVQRYNWGDIARQTADVYRWILKQTDKPGCVYLD